MLFLYLGDELKHPKTCYSCIWVKLDIPKDLCGSDADLTYFRRSRTTSSQWCVIGEHDKVASIEEDMQQFSFLTTFNYRHIIWIDPVSEQGEPRTSKIKNNSNFQALAFASVWSTWHTDRPPFSTWWGARLKWLICCWSLVLGSQVDVRDHYFQPSV